MSPVVWNVLLFISKFILIALVYAVLFIMLRTVRREMSLRLGSEPQESFTGAGRLRVVSPGSAQASLAGEVLDLRPETSLGADPDNDIVLNDPYISGHHALLRWDGADWWVEDQGSRNGTFVNQVRLPPFSPRTLPPGATLQIGGVELSLLE